MIKCMTHEITVTGARLPQRWVFAIMGFLAILNAYTMRICLSITITQMAYPIQHNYTDDMCPKPEDKESDKGASNETRYNWDEPTQVRRSCFSTQDSLSLPLRFTLAIRIFISILFLSAYLLTSCISFLCASFKIITKICTLHLSLRIFKNRFAYFAQGLILSSFYWGYVITHLPGGMLAERFGGKYSLGLGILSTAIFTLLTPVVVQWGEHIGLIVLRVLMGLGEGTTFPALNAMLAQWTPPEERSIIGSMVFAGAQLGTVLANSLSGVILHYTTWPAVFYVFGSIGLLWFVIWVLICYNNPYEHPFISEREVKYLHERMNEHVHAKPPPVPWRHMLTSAPVWALIAAQIGHDWGFFTMVTDLPKYMNSVLHYSIRDNGFVSSLPYLLMWFCSLGSSWLADWMITRNIMSRTNVRKLGTTIASLGPGAFIIGASYAMCDSTLVVTMFAIGMALMGM